jgi:hypothetical protein
LDGRTHPRQPGEQQHAGDCRSKGYASRDSFVSRAASKYQRRSRQWLRSRVANLQQIETAVLTGREQFGGGG